MNNHLYDAWLAEPFDVPTVILVLFPLIAAVLLPSVMIADVGAFHVQYASRHADTAIGNVAVCVAPGLMFGVYPHCLVSDYNASYC